MDTDCVSPCSTCCCVNNPPLRSLFPTSFFFLSSSSSLCVLLLALLSRFSGLSLPISLAYFSLIIIATLSLLMSLSSSIALVSQPFSLLCFSLIARVSLSLLLVSPLPPLPPPPSRHSSVSRVLLLPVRLPHCLPLCLSLALSLAPRCPESSATSQLPDSIVRRNSDPSFYRHPRSRLHSAGAGTVSHGPTLHCAADAGHDGLPWRQPGAAPLALPRLARLVHAIKSRLCRHRTALSAACQKGTS